MVVLDSSGYFLWLYSLLDKTTAGAFRFPKIFVTSVSIFVFSKHLLPLSQEEADEYIGEEDSGVKSMVNEVVLNH